MTATTKHNVNFDGMNIVPSDNIFFSKSIKLLTIAFSGSLLYQGGPLISSPENVVEKRNILSLFKLPVALFKLPVVL